MAKRNRRRKTFHMKPATVGLALMIVLILAPWLGYSLLNLSNDQLANQVKILEQEKRDQEESLRRITLEKDRLTDTGSLQAAVKQSGLNLGFAATDRCVFVSESGVLNLEGPVEKRLLAAKNRRLGVTEESAVAQVETPRRTTTSRRTSRRRR